MSNFQITYNYPWLLLLIIPAVLLALIPYFRLEKKYRRTRNRIISITLHITAMVIAINLLAGIGFSYEVPNEENEVILLVDVSDSGEGNSEEKDEFVRSVIDVCGEGCKIGIVKFGNGHNYAVKLTTDKNGVFEKYTASENPSGSATALADALKYTATLFEHKETSKIVVVSDGIETDGDALIALHEIVSEGTAVDTALIKKQNEADIQIVSAVIKENEIVLGESFTVDLLIKSNSTESEEAAVLRLYDNGELYGENVVGIKNGDNEISVSLSIQDSGMHELAFELVTDYELFGEPLADASAENNTYRTYVNFEEFENILLIERYEGEGAKLKEILSETKRVTDISVEDDVSQFPKDITEIAEYEQVILVNIAYSDMPQGFEALLHEYVYNLGGGLFTVGGECDYDSNNKIVPHAYNKEDIEKSKYFKDMLPVKAENYTPPIAVMLVVDTSTSMEGMLDEATEGALACLDALHDRDYCGMFSFSSVSNERLSVLPVSQRETIKEAIKNVANEPGGSTNFHNAIMKAGHALSVINNVEKKHIILITDGKPTDGYNAYKEDIENNFNRGITMSIMMTVGKDGVGNEADMKSAADAGHGNFYKITDSGSISDNIYNELTVKAIPEVKYEKFTPAVKDKSSIFSGIDVKTIPQLSGFFGTVAKKGATVPLVGEYVPIYATHKYGRGTVGSFMSDLGGEWSGEFVESVVGQALITNIVESIFPHEDVRADSVKYELKSDNYLNWINVHGAPEGHIVSVEVNPVSPHLQHLYGEIDVMVAENNRRFTFSVTEPGLYKIMITSSDEAGSQIIEIPVYKTFSYSREYDNFTVTPEEGERFMADLAKTGGGIEVEDPAGVFSSLEETLTQRYDPRLILIIAAIILVLLDIAVRKFKFKWLHEIFEERRKEKQ